MNIFAFNPTPVGVILVLLGLFVAGLAFWDWRQSQTILINGERVRVNRDKLQNIQENIVYAFDLKELRQLCFTLEPSIGIKFDDLEGEGPVDKARELVLACNRRGKIDKLLAACHEARPNIPSWTKRPEKSLSKPSMARLTLFSVGLSSTSLIVIGMVLLFSISPPQVTLVKTRYYSGDRDPRQIDFGTATTDGIPISANEPLRFEDLEIGVTRDAPEFSVKAEVYSEETLVGYSDAVPLLNGQKIENLYIEKAYEHPNPDYVGSWQVQPAWNMLRVSLIVEKNGREFSTTDSYIRLNPSGNAWFIEPPTAQFTVITYSVNNGPELVMDLRTLGKDQGIDVFPGDTFTLHNVWYHAAADARGNTTVELEAHLNSGQHDPETVLFSTPVTFQTGINSLLLENSFQWTPVPEGREQLTMWLIRDDGTILDRLHIPLNSQTTAGLIPFEEATLFAGEVPKVSLMGISFELGDYNPHLVDLRANPPTIPVRNNSMLNFPEVWLQAEQADQDLFVWVEIFSDETLRNVVGHSDAVRMTSEKLMLDEIIIDDSADTAVADNWRVPEDWGFFYVAVVGQYDGSEDSMLLDLTYIEFDEERAAWLDNSPNVGVVSLAYGVNGNASNLLDLRTSESAGIALQTGDTFKLAELWIHFTKTYEEQGAISLEATLIDTNGRGIEGTKITTGGESLKEGIYALNNIEGLQWEVPENTGRLDLLLVDQNGVVVNKLAIAINAEGGEPLVSAAESIQWPYAAVDYFDFEDDSLMVEVSDNPPFTTVTRSSENAFSGDYSLAVTTVASQTVFVEWDHPFQADVVSMQVFWPDIPGQEVEWAQACHINGSFCWSIPTEEGRWNTVTMNLFGPSYGVPENQMNEEDIGGLFIQGWIRDVDFDTPYTFYVDGIQISPAQ